MKTLFNKYIIAVLGAGMALSACQKDFDPSTYAPPLNIGGYTSSNAIAGESLVAKWSFEDSLKDSVSNNDGTATGTSFVNGFKGKSLQGALNSYALTEPSTAVRNLTSFTISEWINSPPPSTGIVGIFSIAKTNSFWGNFEIFIENGSTEASAKLRVHFYSPTVNDDRTFAIDNISGLLGKWANVTVSYNQATSDCKLYVNGSPVKTEKVTGLTGPLGFANVGNIVFGCVQFQTEPSQTTATGKQDWASYLTGQVDEIRIYNKVLTDEEISSLVLLEGRGK